jgi:hypothetical protein
MTLKILIVLCSLKSRLSNVNSDSAASMTPPSHDSAVSMTLLGHDLWCKWQHWVMAQKCQWSYKILFLLSRCQFAELWVIPFFSGVQYSTSKCSKVACKVSRPFPDGRFEDLWECLDKTCLFTLQSSLMHLEEEYGKSEKSTRFLRTSRFWNVFQIHNIPPLSALNWQAKCLHFLARCCEDLYVNACWIRSCHFASQFGALRKGYCKSKKRFQIPEDFRILTLISDLQFLLLSALKWYTNDLNIFR